MVFSVPAKRKGFSAKEKIIIPLMVFLFILLYVFVLYNPQNRISPPSASSFKSQPWMSFIPKNVEDFRFLDTTQLVEFPNLFSDSILLSIKEVKLNVSVTDAIYGLDIETENNIIVNIIALNRTYFEEVKRTFETSNLTSIIYDKITLYKLKTAPISMQGEAWVSFFDDAIILCEGNITAQEEIKSVYNAASNSFFANDTFKIGYLIASLSENQFIFSFYQSGNNSLNVLWEMRSASNTTDITVREAFYFASSKDLDSKYQEVLNDIFKKSKRTWVSDNFIVGESTYPISDIRAVMMGA
jgi:hypothetical protein